MLSKHKYDLYQFRKGKKKDIDKQQTQINGTMRFTHTTQNNTTSEIFKQAGRNV